MNHRTIFGAMLVTVMATLLPAQAQSGKIQVSQSRDASGNAVIVIHETRPEVLARQREQAFLAQQARAARKRQKQELELARAQAEARAQLQAASASPNGWGRPGELPPIVYNHNSKKPSYRNGGLTTFNLGGFESDFNTYGYDGGYYDQGYFNPTDCPPAPCAPRPECR